VCSRKRRKAPGRIKNGLTQMIQPDFKTGQCCKDGLGFVEVQTRPPDFGLTVAPALGLFLVSILPKWNKEFAVSLKGFHDPTASECSRITLCRALSSLGSGIW
jgi:hypothetical protein